MVTILPVFRYWTVVLDANDVVVPNTADPVDIGVDTEPVGIGSSVPTWMRAGRLSVASTVGEERTLTRESAIRALMKTRRSLVPMMPLIPLPNCPAVVVGGKIPLLQQDSLDRKSTRLNSSHGYISYAVFCLKKKKKFIYP